MDIRIEKCGTCAGCQLEAQILKLCTELNAFFLPKIAELEGQIEGIYEQERRRRDNWEERAAAISRSRRIAVGDLKMEHWDRLHAVTRASAFGCLNVVISVRELPPAPAVEPGRDQPPVQPEPAERIPGSGGA